MASCRRLPLTTKMVSIASFLAVSCLSASDPDVSGVGNLKRTKPGPCMPCEFLFDNLEKNEENGLLSQTVRVQERGEPKSGTGMMMDWAAGALVQTCEFLQDQYGEKSCVVDFDPEPEDDGKLPARNLSKKMTFEPALGADGARCPCQTIERVSIALSAFDKHTLPVHRSTCAFSHSLGIAAVQAARVRGGTATQPACTFADGTEPLNYDDLWRCMHEAECEITDDWLQMVVLRDPRPTIVSSYYHLYVHKDHVSYELGDLEAFVVRELPLLCQWVAVRYIFFFGLLADQSMEFWYSDAMADPLDWYHHWFYSVGVHPPYFVVKSAADAAAANDLGFEQKQVDKHPGEEERDDLAGVRRFEDEVSPELLKAADDVLRLWLPPILLEKFGVEPIEVRT